MMFAPKEFGFFHLRKTEAEELIIKASSCKTVAGGPIRSFKVWEKKGRDRIKEMKRIVENLIVI